MVPIYESTPRGEVGYEYSIFRERFLDICAEHRTAGRALVFAFLLVDVDTPEYIKMLRDRDYWDALDKVSGHFLSVFTLVGHQPQYDHRMEYRGLSGVGPVADPGMKLQLILRSYFGIENTVQLPAVLVFQVDGDGVSGYCLVQLRAAAIEAAFVEVRELLRDLADALANSGTTDGPTAYAAVRNRIRRRKAVRLVKNGVKVLKDLTEIAGLTRGLT